MPYSSAPVLGENWASISDPVERRRAQNRIAQRGYRKRLRKEEESLAQNSQKSSRAKTTIEPAARTPPSPSDSRLPQNQAPQQAAASTTQPASKQRQSESYPYPNPHQQQQTPPSLPYDLHPYTSQLDCVALTGRPWTPSLEEGLDPAIFDIKTPVSDLVHSNYHKLPSQCFHSSTKTAQFYSPPAPPLLPRGIEAAHGHTALHRAAIYGNESVLAVLLQAGADPTLSDSAGLTPLHLAAYQGHTGIVQLLLASGPQPHDIVSQPTRTGETALHLAVQAHQPVMVRILLEHSTSSVNKQDWWGRTALHMACESNQYELVEMLVHAGAQLDIRDFEGQTLLHSACMGAGL
ncbi:uncharacterized protein N7477_004867 [Penicillium maclennaniae]|uniref:uncharacterized protein n=1 Tax=Penicillium maclennaniae TaxID=1343394 RepID=UPI002540DA8B|nr:uncharacterized protein N7477_004867 [Penicillium maclennaniae]KAJ5674933.1 hypothetical protein N7477_004867 [Penicillium maclennaniae]